MIVERLFHCIDEKTSPVVAGLDPVLEQIPPFLLKKAKNRLGDNQAAVVAALLTFNLSLLEVLAPLVPAVKLQKACYEVYGAPGIDCFEQTAKKAQALGLIVIDDSKRGDIGSTAGLYAQALLGKDRPADFATVNPYLGWDGIDPFLALCKKNDRGLFLLVRTSNPSAAQYQEARTPKGPLYEAIAQDLEERAQNWLGARGFSPLGAVVGATWPKEQTRLRKLMPHCLFLVPGYGAQGAKGKEVMPSFNPQGYGALINSSRGIIFAYKRPDLPSSLQGDENFAQAAAWAASEMRKDLLHNLAQAGKLPSNW